MPGLTGSHGQDTGRYLQPNPENRRSKIKTLTKVLTVAALVLALAATSQAQNNNSASNYEPPDWAGKDPYVATPNLSFPVIATDIIDVFYQKGENGEVDLDNPIPLVVTENIEVLYTGIYAGNEEVYYTEYDEGTDCPVDANGDGVLDTTVPTTDPIPMEEWLESKVPWFPQPATTTSLDPNDIWNAEVVSPANSWQADWIMFKATDEDPTVNIDFVDWGNPMENINPIVGQRFPVEVALYKKLENPMTAYKMACLEYPGTRIEVFGTSAMGVRDEDDNDVFTKPVYFATVLTNKFTAEVENPDGTSASIDLEPGIGPSGKMNFASAGGGWTPVMPGWHTIWLRLSDQKISLEGAIVNNDEHYIMTTGCMAEALSPNKLALSGIVGNSTYIDVYVVKPNGKKTK